MNLSTRTSMAGAAALLAVLATTAACGSESVVTDPSANIGAAPKGHPATGVSGRLSADSAERRAQTDKQRQDNASTLRWDRDTHKENQLKYAGQPGRP